MGYLNNSTITVDAILTKRGRELLAQGRSAGTGTGFQITSFALADDEIDYDLWNPAHPLGSDYYGAVIENMPITEAVPDETQSMKYKLITLPKGTRRIPYIQADKTSVTISTQSANSRDGIVTIQTFYYESDPSRSITPATNPFNRTGYSVILLDNTYVSMAPGTDTSLQGSLRVLYAGQPASSESAILVPTNTNTNVNTIQINLTAKPDTAGLLAAGDNKATKLIITGIETGGRIVIPITITPPI